MKVTSKHADATMAKLASVMNRNTTLATGNEPKAAGPVATYTAHPVTQAPATHVLSRSPRKTSAPNASGIRLKPNDQAKIRDVIQAGLALQATLAVSEVLRIALAAYDPKRLTSVAITQVRAHDGRTPKAREGQ